MHVGSIFVQIKLAFLYHKNVYGVSFNWMLVWNIFTEFKCDPSWSWTEEVDFNEQRECDSRSVTMHNCTTWSLLCCQKPLEVSTKNNDNDTKTSETCQCMSSCFSEGLKGCMLGLLSDDTPLGWWTEINMRVKSRDAPTRMILGWYGLEKFIGWRWNV